MASQPGTVLSAPAADSNGRVAVGVLSYLGFTVLLLQVGIVPLLPAIGRQLGLAPGDVAWVLTAELLAGAVGLAVLTRLADLYGKRRIMIVCLSVALAGALIGALTRDVTMLFVARALMGAQAPMLALPEAVANDTMTPRRARRTVVTIHAGNSVGVAGGLLAGGLVGAAAGDYHLYFWMAAVTLALGLLGTLRYVRESPHRATGGFDLPGAVLLAASLVTFLLGTSKGPAWGWGSPQVLGLIIGGLVLAGIWLAVERRSAHPIVDLTVITRATTRLPVVVVFLIAFGIYGAISAVTRFAQTDPAVAGYGFGWTPLQACLFAVPVAIGGVFAAWTLQPIGRRIGFAGATSVSVLCCSVAYFALAATHTIPAPMMVSLAVYALGNTMGLAAAQIIVMQSVPPAQSGVALGVTAIVYAVGNSLGSTVVGVFFAADPLPGTQLPASGAYTFSFLVCGACTTLAALLAWRVRRAPAAAPSATPVR
ncbi:MFS transporter [Nonomuraea sp. K274]|uniref:MFS transporter n=1 Tax=Nonomuraea cypriaca TaxID=1187855 RepID=A0A931AKN5_9ACTN|nr:MFS transporter [Nonomuraea cypriaca]MBF8191950.1 MFS transporter [Nonomuraea cypriaca]